MLIWVKSVSKMQMAAWTDGQDKANMRIADSTYEVN